MYHKHTFKNGLRLVTVPMKNTKAVTVLVLVGTGSKYETKEISGISHFLEHMFFKGTKKRPDSLAISESIERVGGKLNAFTDKELTGYWVKTTGKHLDLALDWVSDVFLNSKIEQREINKEKGVILEEINMYLDNPRAHAVRLWEELLYGNQPAGWSVLGNKKAVNNINRNNFIKYIEDHYTSNNTVIVVAGDINENLKLKIQKYFKGINIDRPENKKRVIEKQLKPGALIHYKKTDQTHMFLGVRAYDFFHKDKYVLGVMGVILGQGLSSRLFTEIREKHGLAYYIKSGAEDYSDSGFFFTRAGIDNKKIDKAINIILKNYKLLKEKKVSGTELKKAKEYIKGGAVLEMESSDEQAEFYGLQELFENRILTLDEVFAKIDSVTVNDIQRVAKDIFKPEKLNLALIGPFKDKKRFEKLLKI